MILSSDEQKALHGISGHLSEQDPRLAAKFAIFTRLTAEEGRPPDEDLIGAIAPPAPSSAPRPPRARRPRRASRRAVVLVPALLLLLILIITISLAQGTGCTTTATRTSAVTGRVATPACRQAGTAKTTGAHR